MSSVFLFVAIPRKTEKALERADIQANERLWRRMVISIRLKFIKQMEGGCKFGDDDDKSFTKTITGMLY
jgi:hypothetical protein